MTSKYKSLDYELENRLRSRLFDATDAHLMMGLFEVLIKPFSNRLYVNNTIAFHNPLWDELKQSN